MITMTRIVASFFLHREAARSPMTASVSLLNGRRTSWRAIDTRPGSSSQESAAAAQNHVSTDTSVPEAGRAPRRDLAQQPDTSPASSKTGVGAPQQAGRPGKERAHAAGLFDSSNTPRAAHTLPGAGAKSTKDRYAAAEDEPLERCLLSPGERSIS
jgi:hypothetical protein